MNQPLRLTSRLTLVAAIAILAAGCGYALVGRAANIPEHIRRIYVEPFENQTTRSEVEQILTRALSEELVTRKRFVVVNGADEADGVLGGAVRAFDATPLSFDDEGRATEYQITITTRVAFRDRVADEVIWENDRYVYKESYPVEVSEAGYFDQERLAIEEVASRFARTMVVDLLQGF